jgi:hypothetical protein
MMAEKKTNGILPLLLFNRFCLSQFDSETLNEIVKTVSNRFAYGISALRVAKGARCSKEVRDFRDNLTFHARIRQLKPSESHHLFTKSQGYQLKQRKRIALLTFTTTKPFCKLQQQQS